jgi:hypothetical protein
MPELSATNAGKKGTIRPIAALCEIRRTMQSPERAKDLQGDRTKHMSVKTILIGIIGLGLEPKHPARGRIHLMRKT